MKLRVGLMMAVLIGFALSLAGQTSAAPGASVSVPPVIQFSSMATDESGAPLSGAVPITFSLYNNSQGGTALWTETQNVSLDSSGHYSVYLGITQTNGIPASLFTGGEAHWLGVRIAGQAEQQPRIFLVSVPYAMKAGDAATVGGLPASAFVLAAPGGTNASASSTSGADSNDNSPNVGGSGTQNYIPLWTDNSGDLGDSILYQSGTTAVGIGTTTPASTLDVNGGVLARGPLQLPATGTATASQGYNSQPIEMTSSVFSSSSGTAVAQNFQWQAEPVNNDKSNASGTLNLLYGTGSGQASETGLNIASNGIVNFVKTQTFPNTVSSITAGTGITIGGTKTNPTVGVNTSFANQYYAQLSAANTFTKNQTVNGTMTATTFSGNGSALTNVNAAELGGLLPSAFQPSGSYASLGANTFTGNQAITGANLVLDQTTSATDGVITMGGAPFISACCANNTFNTFIGEGAGNFTTSASGNTAVGYQALTSMNNLQSTNNTAVGTTALKANLAGNSNTAVGVSALLENTYGTSNTAVGTSALQDNTTGLYNTAVGQGAGSVNTGSSNTYIGQGANPATGNLSYATAIGASAVVGENNALVLGGTGPAAVSVGIGTATPASTLDVRGTGNFTGLVTFAPNQTFPGAGTITGVTPGTDLTGGGSSGNVTLNVNTAALNASYAQLTAANTFTGNQTVNGSLSATGVVTGSSYQIGSNLFAFGSYSNLNAFLGFAGSSGANQNTYSDTAVGYGALANDGAVDNTATGVSALNANTTGYANTATGADAGFTADSSNITGSNNSFFGTSASLSTGSLSNSTAIGANAEVAESNALVLGSINGINGAAADTFVGIGTTAPRTKLEIDGNAPGLLSPTLTMTNNGGNLGNYGAEVSLDFNTYTPSNVGKYNPSARIEVTGENLRNTNLYTDGFYFLVNNPGAPNNGLFTLFVLNAPGVGSQTAVVNGTFGVTSDASVMGNLNVGGTLTKGGGSFKIDHPLDPANKYLYHSFVESPDMMNIYNGVATLDSRGSVWITMPDYFEALNRDFRYQLTSMGRPQPSLYIAREISGNRFRIAGGKPGGRVSWQVTGIRHDAYADAHRIRVEEEKSPEEQGRYLHPELFGAPPEKTIGYRVPASPVRDQLAAAKNEAVKAVVRNDAAGQ